MNNTKWNEIAKAFFYYIECSEDEAISKLNIQWTTKSITDGYEYSDTTWTHFSVDMIGEYKDIEWLRIDLTPQNRKIILDILRKIHVPGEVFDDCVYVYGYRTNVDYIK